MILRMWRCLPNASKGDGEIGKAWGLRKKVGLRAAAWPGRKGKRTGTKSKRQAKKKSSLVWTSHGDGPEEAGNGTQSSAPEVQNAKKIIKKEKCSQIQAMD